MFNFYNNLKLSQSISFFTFYAAILVFNEIGFISLVDDEQCIIKVNKNIKKELSSSKIYNKLSTIKDTLKGEAKYGKYGRADYKPT